MFQSLFVAFLVLFVIYWIFIRDERYDKSIVQPYFEWPLLGHLPVLVYYSSKGIALEHNFEQVSKLGKYYLVLPMIGREIILADPPSVEVILTSEHFILPTIRKALFSEVFGNGIFMSNGEHWSIQRNLAKPIFTVESRTNMFEVYHRCAENLLNILNDTSRSKKPIEIQQLFKRFTLDTFGEIGFGYTINSLIKPIPFSTVFDWILVEVDAQYKFPLRKIYNYFTWKKNLQILEDFVYEIIDKRKKEGFEGKQDFLSHLLELESQNMTQGVTLKFLRDQLINFLIAGRDTTAILISWTLYFLGKNPKVEQKVREEIQSVVGDSKITMQHTKSLKYLQMVLDESLRLYSPAVPFNSRTATQDVVLPNGAKIQKGTTVTYCPWTVHRLKEYWGEDSQEFRPERWEVNGIIKHPYQYVPFQKGPRTCLGMNMAYEEAKFCIAIMFQNGYHFEIDPNHHVRYQTTAILSAKNGIMATVTKV